MKRTLLLAVLLLAVAATRTRAQGAPGATQIDGVTWYMVSYAKFKFGMADEARRIIYEHFWPVEKEIGREVIPFDHVTGEWDHVVYFPMPGGPGELAFTETANGIMSCTSRCRADRASSRSRKRPSGSGGWRR